MHSLLHEAQRGAMKLIFRATNSTSTEARERKLNIAPTDLILEESGSYQGFESNFHFLHALFLVSGRIQE